ncbi:NADPH:quinone reductase [Scheffersomyces spartinae]|uniref:Probable quinone oxidoreductase n=1 Tax=Scheffersomyces spartinae TaxID=45513 RepID=A0A9P7VE88_9ASCO|nr:NADPH:quinone reductase [Scheffersomyces spartinae]KAG7195671.1 NADPH:quinone reductase [Scheffersomyces spartinae]
MTLPKTQQVVYLDGTSEGYDTIKPVFDFPVPTIDGPTEMIIKNRYAGVNYIESYFRKGIYPIEKFPYVMGREALGEVVAVGKDVTKYKVGDFVAYVNPNTFAQFNKITEDKVQVYKLKDGSHLKEYGAAIMQSLTALTFITEAYNVKKDDIVLVWAAAGGVGKILVQLIKSRGAKVIALASSKEKQKEVLALGADYVINSKDSDITEQVLKITNGEGVHASFDSVGKTSFETSLKSLRRKGTFVSFGNSSGPVEPFPVTILSPKNIKFVRPQVFAYISTDEEWNFYASQVAELLDNKKLVIDIYKVYPLEKYAEAAADLESRKTSGKLLLDIPQ